MITVIGCMCTILGFTGAGFMLNNFDEGGPVTFVLFACLAVGAGGLYLVCL